MKSKCLRCFVCCISGILGIALILSAWGVIPTSDRKAWLLLFSLLAYSIFQSAVMLYLELTRPEEQLIKSLGVYDFPLPQDAPVRTEDYYSHRGRDEYAIDFLVPEETEVCAPRAGMVLQTKDDSDRGGPDPIFADDANWIIIAHEDGENSYLAHLGKKSLRVRVGDRVSVGQTLAVQGSTGWTTKPHVHFAVYRGGVTVPIRFSKALPS